MDALDLINLPRLERQLIRELWALRATDGMSLREVSAYLDERGVIALPPWLCKFYQATREHAPKRPAA